jgi:hypothetical protein
MGRMFGHQMRYLPQMLQYSFSDDPVVDKAEAEADT